MHHTARACTFCAHAPPALKQLWVNTVSQTQTFSNAASILLFKMSIANIIVHVCYQMSSWRRKYWTRTYSNDSVHDTVKLSMIHSIRLGLHDGLWERKRKWLFFKNLKLISGLCWVCVEVWLIPDDGDGTWDEWNGAKRTKLIYFDGQKKKVYLYATGSGCMSGVNVRKDGLSIAPYGWLYYSYTNIILSSFQVCQYYNHTIERPVCMYLIWTAWQLCPEAVGFGRLVRTYTTVERSRGGQGQIQFWAALHSFYALGFMRPW